MSRNRDRLGTDTTPQPDTTAPQQLMVDNEPFSFVVPSEFVELPSKGRFYPENHPLHKQEVVEIKHMTAKEEDILTSRALLKKGVAIDRAMQSIIKDSRLNVNTMLTGDRNAVLIAARISGYGSEYITQVTCPACNNQQRETFDLSALNAYDGGEVDLTSEITDHHNGTFTTVLPASNLEVTFRLLTGVDERNLITQLEGARKRKQQENTVTRQLKMMIVAVNGIEERDTINNVVDQLPSRDSRHLRTFYKVATPNVDMSQDFECEACDYEDTLEVPLTADFFWPDR